MTVVVSVAADRYFTRISIYDEQSPISQSAIDKVLLILT